MSVDSKDQKVADQAFAAMVAQDRASKNLGQQIEVVKPGYALVRMIATEAMENFNGTCHGGYVFALADTAFGYACNSYAEPSAGQQCQIIYLKPVNIGDVLVAEARERDRSARSGLYDVTVRNQLGRTVAEFRGYCRRLNTLHVRDRSPSVRELLPSPGDSLAGQSAAVVG